MWCINKVNFSKKPVNVKNEAKLQEIIAYKNKNNPEQERSLPTFQQIFNVTAGYPC